MKCSGTSVIACGEADAKFGLSLPPRSTQGEVQHVSESRHQCGRSGLVALGACLADVLPKKPFFGVCFRRLACVPAVSIC